MILVSWDERSEGDSEKTLSSRRPLQATEGGKTLTARRRRPSPFLPFLVAPRGILGLSP
jgi:hypothetical protein